MKNLTVAARVPARIRSYLTQRAHRSRARRAVDIERRREGLFLIPSSPVASSTHPSFAPYAPHSSRLDRLAQSRCRRARRTGSVSPASRPPARSPRARVMTTNVFHPPQRSHAVALARVNVCGATTRRRRATHPASAIAFSHPRRRQRIPRRRDVTRVGAGSTYINSFRTIIVFPERYLRPRGEKVKSGLADVAYPAIRMCI